MGQTVHLSRTGEAAFIEIDNPPVNALSQSVRAGILEALDQAEADPAVKAIVLFGRGKAFIAGADIKEFGKPPKSPILPDVIQRLEQCDKSVIAVLHGVALGGGLEIALGCHHRIALNNTRLGLPEVKLGLLPGAGGTQRLPRLTGFTIAAEWITEGKLVDSKTALENGLIDQITTVDSPTEAAQQAINQWQAGDLVMRQTGALPNPETDASFMQELKRQLEDQYPDLFAPFRIIEALEGSCTLPLTQGLKLERDLFWQCMESPQRKGLIHAFFASKAAIRVPDVQTPMVSIEQLILRGDHPIFASLEKLSQATGTTASTPSLEVRVASGQGAPTTKTLNIALIDAEASADDGEHDFSLIITGDTAWLELVDHKTQPAIQQALIHLFKEAGFKVVPSKKASIYQRLREINTDGDNYQHALGQTAIQLVQEGLCYRPADIDVIATETLGFPTHLGGPHFQASLSAGSHGVA